jgi:D-glycero-D-manno-heptose 1,7-bisphosphate phosphatase
MQWVILDRDGVINHDSDDYIKSADEWLPIPGSLEAIARLNNAGVQVAVISNQSGIGRKLFNMDDLAAIHAKMHEMVREAGGHIEAVFFCPHLPDAGCNCRKPKAGMFEEASRRLRLALDQVCVVGDNLSDVVAARRVGAQPVLVRTGKGARVLKKSADKLDGVPVFDDLAAATEWLLDENTPV